MNRHQKLAIFIAPFLIVIGYIATDYYLKETEVKPVAEAQALPLSLNKPCNLLQTICELTQDNIGLKIQIKATQTQLLLSSNLALESVIMAFNTQQPQLLSQDGDTYHWQINLTENRQPIDQIRLVTSIDKHHYFAEIIMVSF